MLTKIKNKAVFFRKSVMVLFLVLSFLLAPATQPAKAWDAIPAMLMDEAWRTIQDTIKGIQLGLAKQAAITALQQQLSTLITGRSSSGALFVTNWQSYLITQPQSAAINQTRVFINDSLSGRGSLTGYVPAGSEGFGANYSYQSQLAQNAMNSLNSINTPNCRNNYVGDPSLMFANGNFKNFSLYLAGNDPWTSKLCFDNYLQQQIQNQQMMAQAKINGTGGILPNESNGQVVAPASLVQAQVNKVQTMGLDVITTAQHLPEIIASAVSMTINQAMVQGIGQMSSMLNREVTNVRSQATGQLNNAIQQVGPGALYKQITH